MTIRLQIRDAIPRDEIDSLETLKRIREEAKQQGLPVHPSYGNWPIPTGAKLLTIANDGFPDWAFSGKPIKRIIHVSDLLAPDEPEGHPAAPILREIAEVAEWHPRPWEEFKRWPKINLDRGWIECSDMETLLLCVGCGDTVRRKPRTVTRVLDGETWELPKPETEAPEEGTKVYVVLSIDDDGYCSLTWANNTYCNRLLSDGFIHLYPENVTKWAEFFRAAAKGGE